VPGVHVRGRSTWNPEDYTGVQIADDMGALIERAFDGQV
jgi:hypothetical protein